MPSRRAPSHAVYAGLDLQKLRRSRRARRWLWLLLCPLAALLLYANLYLRRLSSDIALSDARDAVTLAVNDVVGKLMTERAYGYDYFITLQKDAAGEITAITTDAAHINAVSAEILREIVQVADNGDLDIRIPLGSLLGSNLLLGRGPEIPVEIRMLTSSFVRFDNALTSTGINQSRHTLALKADVDVDIVIPWQTLHTTVETEILIAETVIVGRVPDTYVNWGKPDGRTGSESQDRSAAR
jgi:sporulation protein YunB